MNESRKENPNLSAKREPLHVDGDGAARFAHFGSDKSLAFSLRQQNEIPPPSLSIPLSSVVGLYFWQKGPQVIYILSLNPGFNSG